MKLFKKSKSSSVNPAYQQSSNGQSKWVCKKCNEPNTVNTVNCRGCGSYK